MTAIEIRSRDEAIEILAGDRPPGEAGAEARRLLDERGDALVADHLEALTGAALAAGEARRLWADLLAHKYLMSERLGRNVGIRVAALDFFANVLGRPGGPRLVRPEDLDRLHRAATTDPLTGLANRRAYRARLTAEIDRCRRYDGALSIALLDLDGFKALNDRLGHAEGDRVLRRVADSIRAAVRSVDLPARWGGEEFVVVMPATPKRGGLILAERIRARVETDADAAAAGAARGVTISGGLAAFPRDAGDEDSLLAFADGALYRAKAEGRNRIAAAPVERRAHERRSGRFPLRLVVEDGDGGRRLDAHAADVSAGGLSFRHAEPPSAEEVRGVVGLDGWPARFTGRIVRAEPRAPERPGAPAAGPYDVGVAFTRLEAAAGAGL